MSATATHEPTRTPVRTGPMTGVWPLVRSFLRRDRWVILAWAAGVTLLYYSQAVSIEGLYQTQAEFDRAAAAMEGNASFIAMAGPTRALNTIGGQVTWQASAFGAICVGLMSMFLIGRHTRAEEESGRDEVLRASAISSSATTTAAVIVTAIANLAVGVCVSLSLISYPLAAEDSWALGLGLVAAGLVFTAVALVAAQITSTTRATYGIAGAFIGVSYLMRAIGDIGPGWLSWLSPIGVYQRLYAFSGVRWWPVLILLAVAVVVGAVGFWLRTRRDFGGGLLVARPGPPRASRTLADPRRISALGLAFRLQREQLIGWCVGMLVAGVAFGSLGTDVDSMFGDGAAADAWTGGAADLVTGLYSFMLVMLALLVGVYAVTSALRPHHEEQAGRVESLVATGLSRSRWLAANVAVTVIGTLLVALMAGLGMVLALDLISGLDDAWRYFGPMLGYVAPALVLSGLARLCHGLIPRFAGLAWAGVGLVAVVLVFGELLNLPRWVIDLSPYSHLALAPLESFSWGGFAGVLVVAILLSLAGQGAFRRRDVQ